jgi:hypothetical protein
MPKMCAFCSNDAVEHGGEHGWDDWLNEWLPVTGYTAKYSSTTGEKREYKKKRLEMQLSVVCERCNNNWMSQVTKRIKQTFAYAIRDGSSLCILPTGIALLAAFTLMKAVCFNHEILSEDEEPFFTRACRERLGKSLEVPSVALRMWIGAFQGKALHSTKASPMLLSSSAPPLQGMQYFAFTYVVGKIVLQLCAGRWKNVHHRGGSIIPMLAPDPYWDQAAIKFWPYTAPIEWPPPKHFGDDTIQQFINRFKDDIKLR